MTTPTRLDLDVLAEVWIAFDNDRLHAVASTREHAQRILDDYLAQVSSVTVHDPGWVEPGLEPYRDGSRFKRWYTNALIVRGDPLRSQEVRRMEVLRAALAPTPGAEQEGHR